MRSYQVKIGIDSPLTLRAASGADDKEAMFRFLNNLLGDVGVEVERFARNCLERAREQAAAHGYVMSIPPLDVPMGVSSGLTDVTGHVGRRWQSGDAQ